MVGDYCYSLLHEKPTTAEHESPCLHRMLLGLYHWSQQADGLADTVGSNEPGAANLLYSASARLCEAAETRAQEFKKLQKGAE